MKGLFSVFSSLSLSGKCSLYLLIGLFFVSTFAEFVANEKPLFLSCTSGVYWPLFSLPSDSELGGFLPISADFQSPATQKYIQSECFAIHAPIAYSEQTIDRFLDQPPPTAPSKQHLLGTDDQGRDVLARTIYGTRTSLFFALSLTLISSILGTMVGFWQAYKGGLVDLVGQRIVEVWSSLPVLFILIIISSILVMNFWVLLLAMIVFEWTALVYLVRVEVLKVKNSDFVLTARAIGASDWHISTQHILPNSLIVITTLLPFLFSGNITALTALDFLGFGLPPGEASLGDLVNQAKNNIGAPWIGLSVITALALILISLVIFGHSLREALDNKLKSVHKLVQ